MLRVLPSPRLPPAVSRPERARALQPVLHDVQFELVEIAADNEALSLGRHFFTRIFPRALAHAKHSRQAVTVIMCGVDLFKRVNDNYGHPVGAHGSSTAG